MSLAPRFPANPLGAPRRDLPGLLDTRREQEADDQFRIYIRPLGRGWHMVHTQHNDQAFRVGSALGRRTFQPGQVVVTASNTGHPGEIIIGEPPPGLGGASAAPIRRDRGKYTPGSLVSYYAYYLDGTDTIKVYPLDMSSPPAVGALPSSTPYTFTDSTVIFTNVGNILRHAIIRGSRIWVRNVNATAGSQIAFLYWDPVAGETLKPLVSALGGISYGLNDMTDVVPNGSDFYFLHGQATTGTLYKLSNSLDSAPQALGTVTFGSNWNPEFAGVWIANGKFCAIEHVTNNRFVTIPLSGGAGTSVTSVNIAPGTAESRVLGVGDYQTGAESYIGRPAGPGFNNLNINKRFAAKVGDTDVAPTDVWPTGVSAGPWQFAGTSTLGISRVAQTGGNLLVYGRDFTTGTKMHVRLASADVTDAAAIPDKTFDLYDVGTVKPFGVGVTQ